MLPYFHLNNVWLVQPLRWSWPPLYECKPRLNFLPKTFGIPLGKIPPTVWEIETQSLLRRLCGSQCPTSWASDRRFLQTTGQSLRLAVLSLSFPAKLRLGGYWSRHTWPLYLWTKWGQDCRHFRSCFAERKLDPCTWGCHGSSPWMSGGLTKLCLKCEGNCFVDLKSRHDALWSLNEL